MTTKIKKKVDANMFAFLTVLFAGALIPSFVNNIFHKIVVDYIHLENSYLSNIIDFVIFSIILWFSVKYFLQLWMSKRYTLSGDIKTKGLKEATITFIAWTALGFVMAYFAHEITDISTMTILAITSIIETFIFYYALKRYIPLMRLN